MSFKDELKKERARLGWSQQKLADNLQIPKRNIENWESEDRTPPKWVCSLLLEKLKSIKVHSITLKRLKPKSTYSLKPYQLDQG